MADQCCSMASRSLHDTGPDGRSSAEATAEQLTKLLAFHETLLTWALDGRHAKHKKADGPTQVYSPLSGLSPTSFTCPGFPPCLPPPSSPPSAPTPSASSDG